MTLNEMIDEVEYHIERCSRIFDMESVKRKDRWITQGEYNAYVNLLEMLKEFENE